MKQKFTMQLALAVGLLALVGGCGQKEEAMPVSTPKSPTKPPVQAEAASIPGAPPAPDAVAPAPQAAAAAVAPGAPAGNPTAGDPLIQFRRAPDQSLRSDLDALNAAVYAYCQHVGKIPDFNGHPIVSLKGKDLSFLVEIGFLSALPTPPAGKKYVLDQKTMGVSLK